MNKLGKSIIAVLCSLFVCTAVIAQDASQAAEAYNKAATVLNEGKTAEALAEFKSALSLATAAGEEGVEIATQCKGIIPKLLIQLGKEDAANKNMDAAIEKINEAIAKAKEYGQEEEAEAGKALIPQLIMADANSLLNESKFAEAAAEYKKLTEIDPANGVAYLRLGMCESRLGNEDSAIAAFQKAEENGQQANADKELSKLYLKKAQDSYKAKNFDACIAAANDCIKVGANPAATYFLGMAYVGKKDYAKACIELKKIQNEAKYKESVGKLLPQLQCK